MRTNLAVPFQEKDEAKRLGARWDYEGRTWYVEDVENLEQFLRWIPTGASNASPSTKALRKRYRKPAKLEIRAAPKQTGELYRPSCGKCQLPPWVEEGCACSFKARANADWDRLIDLAGQI